MKKPKAPTVHCKHHEMRALAELRPHPMNPNRHPDEQIRMLAKIISVQGWRSPVVVSARSGYVVAGHGRMQAAKLLGLEVVPVDVQEFESEELEIAHLMADNRIAELAEMDRSALRELAEMIDNGEFDMELSGFDDAALEELMTAAPPEISAQPSIGTIFEIGVKCDSENHQRALYERLTGEGLICRVLTL